MEFIQGGELFTYLRSVGKFTPSQGCFYSSQIALMFEYMHSFNVVYRDLKPENLMIDTQGYLKLTDFGFAKIIEGRTYTLCGTPEYLAPEILTNKGHGKGVDWWTLGVIIYEMIAGIDPFNDEDPMSIYKNILKGVVKFPFSFDSDAKSLVKHLLQADLSKRYGNLSRGALDVKEHRFFAKINWSLIQDKKIEAPYKPEISSESDTSNFSSYSSAEDQIVPAVKPEMDPFLKWSS